MIGLEDRQALARGIRIAHEAGARLAPACDVAGIDLRTVQRCKAQQGLTAGDGRPQAVRPMPSHALSVVERAALLAVANEPRFAAAPPARIVPMLADEGVYLGSESSMARVLKAAGQNKRRGRAKAPRATKPPTTHIATAPGQVWCGVVWCWDMTYLPARVMGRWFHLYLILDLYSRKTVDAEVHGSDDSEHAVPLVRRTALAEGIAAMTPKPVLHGDNGATLKATTVLAMPNWLGIKPSYSRPRVSDDNAYAESLFRTAKYRPESLPRALRRWAKPVLGPPSSCVGTRLIIGTAASAMSVRTSVTPAKTRPSWRHGTHCIARPRSVILRAGLATPETGHSSTP
jgi:putative transposase